MTALTMKTPFTYEDHQQVMDKMKNGELTPQTLQAYFEQAADLETGLWVTLNKKTIAQLDEIDPHTRGKKKQKVESVATGLLIGYGRPTGESSLVTSYSGPMSIYDMMRKPKEERPDPRIQKVEKLRERVGTITQDMLNDYAAQVAENRRQIEKALANPETLKEYIYKIRSEGLQSLTPVQLVTWDRLYYEAHQADIEKERAEAAIIRQIDLGDDASMEIEKSYHTKKEVDIWVVKLTERVERDVFNELRNASKRLGGYYSRFTGGFVFWEEEDAQQFVSLQDGDASAEERQQRVAEMKKEQAANRLLDYAARHIDAAQYELTRERLLNTFRRVSIAQGMWQDARNEEALARTVEAIATAIDDGTAGALQGLKWVTQIVTLYDVLKQAHRTAVRDENGRYDPDGGRSMQIGDIAHARYPKPFARVETLKRLIDCVKGRRGTRGLTGVVEAIVKNVPDGHYWVNIEHPKQADIIVELAGVCKDTKTKQDIYEQFADHKRLTGLGIRNIFVLRHVLRVFFPYVHPEREADPIRAAELAIVGRKFDGFFPTPYELVELMINEADIQDGHTILEPSAGKGNIVDGILDHFGDRVTVDCLEIQPALRDILGLKGYNVIGRDFTDHNGRTDYDRVLMNPPFENKQDQIHVERAYGRLRVGGRLVAIMSTGWTFSTQKNDQRFKAWVESVGWWQPLPENSFAESGTGVNTVLVVLDK